MAHAEKAGHLLFELLGEATGGEPEIQRGIGEAADLIGLGAARPVSSLEELRKALQEFRDPERRYLAGQAAARYVEQERGASRRILEKLQEKRLLTSS